MNAMHVNTFFGQNYFVHYSQIIKYFCGNYDEDSEGNEDYDPDEDLRMMYDDEEYDELHES